MTRTPTKESHDPNRGPVSALKKRPPAGGDAASPSKQQRKKNKGDKRSRRVSFAPDPELTMMHFFEKDELSAASSEGRPVLSRLSEGEDGGPEEGGYRPGFLDKTIPDSSLPLPLDDDSPGMDMSMEITQPVLAAAQQQQQQQLYGENDFDELLHQGEEGERGPYAWVAAGQPLPGEVTAGLPSLGALAEADALDEQEGDRLLQQQGPEGWRAPDVTLTLTANITGAVPGLGSLIEEDEAGEAAAAAAAAAEGEGGEEVTAGMDLTIPAGRVLEHAGAMAAVVAPARQPAAEEVLQPEQGEAAAAQASAGPAAEAQPAAQPTPEPAAELQEQVPPGRSARRSSLGDLSRQRVEQVNKWGFAPGGEDTLDINLELHGRMIMGDTTFNRMYGDNTTGETTLGQEVVAGQQRAVESPMAVAAAPVAAAVEAVAEQQLQEEDMLLSPAASPLPLAPPEGQQQEQQQPQPNWQAPAFVPPYMQTTQHTITSMRICDHPALVQSPADTNSTMNTGDTRRVSVGAGDTRRLSINSRRDLQDATGRLLQDGETGRLLQDYYDDDMDLDLGLGINTAPQPFAAAGKPAMPAAARDVTENLLADDLEDEDDLDDHGALAGMKRQLRILSQEAQQEQAAAVQVAAEEGEEVPAQKAAQVTPRQAHSLGVADSSNPATMALLRSGGTTRLLQDTVHARPRQQAQQQLARAAQPALTGGGNGTTKLLADITMASMVGAKLRQSAGLGGRRLSVGDADNGLTDFSLDGFDTPPELPMAQQQQQQQQIYPSGTAQAQHYLAEASAQREQQHQQQPPAPLGQGQASGLEKEAAGSPQEGVQQHNGTAQPGQGTHGYPPLPHEELPVIPGGPKLARTPPGAAAPAVSQRNEATPRSVRSMPQQATPASRRQDRTPVPAARPTSSGAAAYPVPEGDTIDRIPGGPKLARTPLGGRPSHLNPLQERTPGGARLRTPASMAPGSAMAQHYPGAGQPPASAMALRYPGSAVAAHRLGARGMTPLQQQQSQPLPMTFQDFTKLMDVQFLDNLRRGASINYADMQRNPVPKTIQEAYTLLCAVSPQVTVLENGIRILQELVQERRSKAAESEAFIGLHNPQLFAEVQYVDEEQLEAMKSSVALLKKLLRQKAVAELKAYRKEMEEDKAHRLARNLELLQQDCLFLEGNEKRMNDLAHAAQQHVATEHRRMEEEAQAHQAEAERRQRVMAMRASLAEQREANAQRQQQLQEVHGRVAGLKTKHSVLQREREAVQGRIQELEQRLAQSQDAAALALQSSPQALLEKHERQEVLTACSGLRLERFQQGGGAADLVLRLGELFRMQLHISGGAATGSAELVAGAVSHLAEGCRQLLAGLVASQGRVNVNLAGAGTANLTAALQVATARLACVADLAKELERLRLSCPSLSEVVCSQGAIRLAFINLETEVQFCIALGVPGSYPLGEMAHDLEIRSDGNGHVTPEAVAEVLTAVPEERGRLLALCAALSELASSAPPAQPFFLRPPSPTPHATPLTAPGVLMDANFQNYENPLYGASASCSMAS